MSKKSKLREVFGTGRQSVSRRRKMCAFLRGKGVSFPNAPSNVLLWGLAKTHGFDLATYVEPKKPTTIKQDMQRIAAGRSSKDFYISREWRAIRYQALKANDGRCELCGASKHDGTMLHVDHILPRSKFPKLELEPTNLQILCEDCNLGKSNKDQTDWRKPKGPAEDEWSEIRQRMGEA